ncbi:DUF2913 family protein [Serratia marcescens]|uniref:DUF2913 family protein n=1 Tax=Serratia marcescens TaxID=615 RepID=A0A5C7BVZ0_SERMA|nr:MULTISPECIES: DUF2913 family protein [Serratia]TXE27164.1 DUF2913 family protein [Serratia marcescens]TXE55279.1 DUF2913 family protein [Serratia marcescens]
MATPAYQKRPTAELAHLAWCLLVALRLAQHDGRATSALQQHLFIMRWLATAQKRKLFPRAVAPDMLWLQAQGNLYGMRANLRGKVDYIYRSSAGTLASQSDLFRFTYAIETLKNGGWEDNLVSEHEWNTAQAGGGQVAAVYTRKQALSSCFDDKQTLIRPLFLRFTGDVSSVPALFAQCALPVVQQTGERGFSVFAVPCLRHDHECLQGRGEIDDEPGDG